ncbi:GNAT family N-acetyltransferase [Pseudogemmobacter humi]|uniref:Acetyltransferase (GNAT) family protein n=1 Tax=Pseudogemmobacter humi TaxID=2483812 RepID=A0A3P5WV60_9RHOB|nr:GNAT family N-acetyltransferase [Pseudogemmobacter humi]VDC25262.1 Acetyltransferase (GNAT) family protein [Pseudogemmobacter humi]
MILRAARAADAGAMADLQNGIIALGGTTAYQQPRSVAEVRESYITGADVICCHVAEEEGRILGFQSVGAHPGLPAGMADIGTFVASGHQRRGIGVRLFGASRAACRAAGITALNATIRADNPAGLACYARLGFADYAHDPAWALADGRVVGRISKRLDL